MLSNSFGHIGFLEKSCASPVAELQEYSLCQGDGKMSALAGKQLQTLQGDVRTCGHLHTHKACMKTRTLKIHRRQTQISFEQSSITLACEQAALNQPPAQGVPALHRKMKHSPCSPHFSLLRAPETMSFTPSWATAAHTLFLHTRTHTRQFRCSYSI